jgi:formylglycine-generating enzyme required for sulfatase activity
MGIVFKARDRETGEIVAVKVLKAEIGDQPKLIDAFKNELRLARKITHKNVCRIYDFNRSDGTSFITMEFVEGESLRRVLNRFNTLSARTGIKIARQICEGLREAHVQGIIHRDLKPENLMIDGSGNVKLMDFGLAHLMAEGSTAAVGTPSYMAPEQAQGGTLDQRCDIYALGLVLFEMFTGTPAFTGDTPMAVALKQIQDRPANPRELDRTIPDHIVKAILRCLEKDPAKRFQSVEELEAALVDEPPSNKIVSAVRKDAPWMAVGLATVAAIIVVAAVILTLSRVPGNQQQRDSGTSDAEFAAFHMAESLNTVESWNAFLKDHPKGELVSAARERIVRLQSSEPEGPRAPVETTVAAIAPKPADATPRPKLMDFETMAGGVFMMGNDEGKADEKPRHQVRLDSFRVSRSPITNRQYFSFLEDTGHPRPKDPAFAKNYLLGYPDLPVVNVSYDDAVAYCKWASAKFGTPVRLPTEAEWEYSAHTHKSGNMWEWVSDFYSKDYYTTSPVKNPMGPASGSKRVIRAVSRRGNRESKDRGDQIGFRVVQDTRPKH